MIYLYYTPKKEESQTLLQRALNFHGASDFEIIKNENGKPYLKDIPLFFSVSHTEDLTAVAISEEELGLDVEKLTREVKFPLILKRYSLSEQKRILTGEDFIRNWTAKESFIKKRGEKLSTHLFKLEENEGAIYLDGKLQNEFLTHIKIDGFNFCICRSSNCKIEIRLI